MSPRDIYIKGLNREPWTGDALACYGRGFASWFISWFTPRWRVWRKAPSHVAAIVVHGGKNGTEPFVYESTSMSKLKDVFTGKRHEGVQAHRWADWLHSYDGKVQVLPLKVHMTPDGEKAAVQYAQQAHNRQTAYDWKQVAGAGTPILNTENGRELFCSEFLAFLLRKGGSIGTHWNCSEVTPHDVTGFVCFDDPITVKRVEPEPDDRPRVQT